MNAVTTTGQKPGLIAKMAAARSVDPDAFYKAVKNVVMPASATTEQTLAFLLVADRYGLDPMLKEIHCFLDKRTQNIVPMISIDGWAKMMNNHPAFDGIEFDFHKGEDGTVEAITARIFRKDRGRPIAVTEYLNECFRGSSDAWKQTPTRMLRHRALIQCVRIAFGFSGAFSEDDQVADVQHDITLERNEEPVKQIEAVAAPAKPAALRRPPSPSQQRQQYEPEREQQQAAPEKEQQGEQHDPETGEVIEGDLFDAKQAIKDLSGAYAGATSHDELDDIYNRWAGTLAQITDEGQIRQVRSLYDQHHRRITAG